MRLVDERAPADAGGFPAADAMGRSRGPPHRGSVISLSETASPRATLIPASPRLTSKRQSFDTAGSALTGRHQPAAREHSHLFGLSRVRVHLLSAWFQRGTGDS